MPAIGDDYSLRGLMYQTPKGEWYEVYVISKNDTEFDQHALNLQLAGLETKDGGAVMSIKADVAEAILANPDKPAPSLASVLRGGA